MYIAEPRMILEVAVAKRDEDIRRAERWRLAHPARRTTRATSPGLLARVARRLTRLRPALP